MTRFRSRFGLGVVWVQSGAWSKHGRARAGRSQGKVWVQSGAWSKHGRAQSGARPGYDRGLIRVYDRAPLSNADESPALQEGGRAFA